MKQKRKNVLWPCTDWTDKRHTRGARKVGGNGQQLPPYRVGNGQKGKNRKNLCEKDERKKKEERSLQNDLNP